jgi:hypothetical protein
VPVDASKLTPAGHMNGEGEEDTRLLLALADRARSYLSGFAWTASVDALYFGDGIGRVVAVFLADITPAQPGVDEQLWVVVGDLPSLYLVTDDAPTPADALAAYTDLAEEWVHAAERGAPLDGLMPVGVPATEENIAMLRSRVEMLRRSVLPWFAGDDDT